MSRLPLIECVPNFSEGRSNATLAALAETASSVRGVMLLEHSADASHNRSVYTLAGSPEGIERAALALAHVAAERIDLTRHAGGHPRMGALDVLPLIPLRGVTMDDCAALARRIGQRLWEEMGIPVILYENAASAPHRRNLADVRRGGFEGLAGKLASSEWTPDFGHAPHPTAGATAVGAREFLVAFNVLLDTPDKTVADAIARAVRGSSGGFPHCKAIGVELAGRGAQVSMNLTDYRRTPLYRVFEAVKTEANRLGARVVSSELIGLSPAEALCDSAAYYLQMENYRYPDKILEAVLSEQTD